jgi:hypothetical protein
MHTHHEPSFSTKSPPYLAIHSRDYINISCSYTHFHMFQG